MSDYITKIRTADGDLPVDYESLANKPSISYGVGENSIQQVGSSAEGDYSHAGGKNTKATAYAQTAIGKYNIENADALLIVGNGEDDSSRSNAFEVLQNGSIVIGGITLTAEKLAKIIKFIDSIEEVM